MKFTGEIISIKPKETRKGYCLAYLCKSKKTGNKFWFMAWNKPFAGALGADGVPTTTFMEGQEVVVGQDEIPEKSVKVDDITGIKIVFLSANPKYISSSKITPTLLRQKELTELLEEKFGQGRIAKGIANLYDQYKDRIDSEDEDFLSSLATEAEKYESVSAKQYPYCVKFLAKYGARIKAVGEQIEAAADAPEARGDLPPTDTYGNKNSGPKADLNDEDF